MDHKQMQGAGASLPPTLDLGELARVLGDLTRRLQLLEGHFEDYTRQTHGGEDAQARSDLAALTSRVATLESHNVTWAEISEKPTAFPPASHGNEKHSATFITGVSWDAVTGKPSTFTPSAHGNEAHSTTFITGVSWDAVTGKPSAFPPESHGNEKHSATFITGVSWDAVTGKPSTFTPSGHGNEAHSPDYLSETAAAATYVTQTTYNAHKHGAGYANYPPSDTNNYTHVHTGINFVNTETSTPR